MASAIHPLSHTATNDKVLALLESGAFLRAGMRVLDLGAGAGYFSSLVGARLTARGLIPTSVLAACDVHPEIFAYDGIRCDAIESPGRIPYPDGTFDAVCSLEVIEHVQDQFLFCRDVMRVLRPGGVAILSTPNVLNINSRWRMLHSGFATLFTPLSLSSVDVVHTSGHIHPVSYYYLAYALRHAGAESVRAEYDRFKSSARAMVAVLWPVLALGAFGFRRRIARRWPTVYRENAVYVNEMHSVAMLTARSIVVVARKGLAG